MVWKPTAPVVPSGHRDNLLLRSLGELELNILAPHLVPVSFSAGENIILSGERLTHVLFPQTLVVSFHESGGFTRPAIGMVGLEGMIGWSVLLGAESPSTLGIAQMRGGSAFAIETARFQHICRENVLIGSTMLRFVHNFMTQMAFTIGSHSGDSIEIRVARWLLMLHDRSEGDMLGVTHDHVSNALGVRRASVTDCLHILEGDALLRCERGRIRVRDRERLELLAGGSYGKAEAGYRRYIGNFGKTPAA